MKNGFRKKQNKLLKNGALNKMLNQRYKIIRLYQHTQILLDDEKLIDYIRIKLG